MRILFLNQYFPPDPAPTGVLFRELADEFSRLGHTVDFVDAGGGYREGQGRGGRMRREVAALWRMLRAGRARSRADVVISGTSPPCLAVVADRVARSHGAAHVHWAMDVYPEIATALGEIGNRSLVGRIAGMAMRSAYRRAAAVIALDADMQACLRGHGIRPLCIRPWVSQAIMNALGGGCAPVAPWTWIYSGNLGRAHEWETLLRAQALIEERQVDARLLFQGGGPSWAAAAARAQELGLRSCEWRSYVPEHELPASLLRCEALVVTQRPEVRGLLWPSKLALVRTLPRPLLFVGPTEGAIAGELRRLPHAGIFAPGDAEGVARWITEMRARRPDIRPEALVDPGVERESALRLWKEALAGAVAHR
jgi:glycosyltransferase involved in cell wall biosynthesis